MLAIEQFADAVTDMKQCKNGCYYWSLGTDNNRNNWAIVLGWSNGFDEDKDDELSDGTWHLCVKIAYQPYNSMMQCDYDVDWIMPYDEETGEVWDTDTSIYLDDNHKETIDWLMKEFSEMKKILPCWN